MSTATKEVTLIHGLRDAKNRIIKNIKIRPLVGFDEDLLNQMETKDLSYPIKTSHILSRIITFGNEENCCGDNMILDRVRNLTIGDRAYLMFLLRQLTFGDIICFDVECSSCKNTMTITLSISELLASLIPNQKESNVTVDDNTGIYHVNFSDCVAEIRLLNGIDQEYISSQNITETNLLHSCILNIDSLGLEKLSDNDFVNFINSTLSNLDPLSDIILTQDCPSCNASFQVPFIIEDFYFKEIRSRKNNLEFEVHWLALNYHWSESEILSLPIAKRRRYVELVNNAIGGG
jgi:hypothetical protein